MSQGKLRHTCHISVPVDTSHTQMKSDNPYLQRTKVSKHGQQAERKAARRLGGRQTPSSGSRDGAKGDIRLGQFLIENKATKRDSITLEFSWLRKIAKEAEDVGKVPVLTFQFVDSSGTPRLGGQFVVFPERILEEMPE